MPSAFYVPEIRITLKFFFVLYPIQYIRVVFDFVFRSVRKQYFETDCKSFPREIETFDIDKNCSFNFCEGPGPV